MGMIIGFIISVVFAFLLGFIAHKRGAKVMFWAIMGLVFGPFAIPFVFFAITDQSDKHAADHGNQAAD